MALRWADRNLSKLEVISVVCVLLILFNVFLGKVLKIFINAERSMVENTLINMNTALRFHALHYQIKGDNLSLKAMDGMNPVEVMTAAPDDGLQGYAELSSSGKIKSMLIKPPVNYAGEFSGENAQQVPKGRWYFDPAERSLVYHVRSTGLFRSNVIGTERLRYSVRLLYDDVDQDGQFDPVVDRYQSIKVVPHDEYVWRIE